MNFCFLKFVLLNYLCCCGVYSARLKVQRGRGIETDHSQLNSPSTSNKDEIFSYYNYGKSIPAENQAPAITGLNVIGDMTGRCISCPAKYKDKKGRTLSQKVVSPGYQAGYDKEGRPVWVLELNALSLGNYVSSGIVTKILSWQNTLFDQIQSSITDGNNTTGYALILDLGGNYMSYLSSLELMATVKLILDNLEDDEISGKINYGFGINMTPTTEIILERLGFKEHKVYKQSKFYGTDPNVWKAAILEKIEKAELPPQYGGEANFFPAATYPIISKL